MADDRRELTVYDAKFAEWAQQYAETERVGGDFLSTRGGILKFEDEPLPGNQMCVIILDVVQERTYYEHEYNPDAERAMPPVCYAFARTPQEIAEMAPHPSMQVDLRYFVPQSEECATCPNNEWGSANKGRGKACSERRRLALLPAGYYTPRRGTREFDLEIFTDPDHFANADIAFLKIPVTSVKDYARWVTQLNSSLRKPPFAVIARVWLEPDEKSQFRVKFETIEEVPAELFDIIIERHEEAKAGIIFGYPPPGTEAEPAPAQQRGSVRRGVR